MTLSLQVASECRFASSEDLLIGLAARIWDLVAEAVEQDNKAAMIVSGGSTPIGLYNVLRELPLPWEQLDFCPSDERWVPVDDPASNEGMLRRELIDEIDPATFVSMARQESTPQADAKRVEQVLETLSRPWDLVLLGMGNDGHTASLFPSAEGLTEALSGKRRCVAVTPAGQAHPRLTLSRSELLRSKRIILLLHGPEKWRVYREALRGDDVEAMPVRALLHQQQVPVDVYWSLK